MLQEAVVMMASFVILYVCSERSEVMSSPYHTAFRNGMYTGQNEDLFRHLELDLLKAIKKVNGITPDENGNINIPVGGSSELAHLEDVSLVGMTDKDVLTYDSTLGKWVPAPNQGKASSYILELSKWGISNVGTKATETTTGINNALDWASNNGFTDVVFPKGTYLISKDSAVKPVDYLTIDLNGATLKKETNNLQTYSVVSFKHNQKYVTIKNGKIVGDKDLHDYSSGGTHEGGYGIELGSFSPPADGGNNLRFIVLENLEISDFTGDSITLNSSFGQILPTPTNLASSWELGTISNTDGTLAASTTKIRSTLKFDMTQPLITKYKYFGLYGNGYGGLGADIKCDYYDVIFYKSNDAFISSAKSVQFFDEVEVPTGASYARVVLHQSNVPVAANCTINVRVPTFAQFVYINKCDLHHNRRQGISVCGAKNLYIDGNQIHHISGVDPQSGIDIEDGYDLNQMIHINKNFFYSNEKYNIIVVNGKNIFVKDNVLLPPTNSGYVSLAINGGADKVVATGNIIRFSKVTLFGEVLFANNYMYGCQVTSTVVYATKQTKIEGCTFHNCKYVSDNPYPFSVTVDNCSFFNDVDKLNVLSTSIQWTLEVKQEPQSFVNCIFQGKDVNYLTYVGSAASFKQGWIFQNCKFKNTKDTGLLCGTYVNCDFTELSTFMNISRNTDATNSLELVNCNFSSTDGNNALLTVTQLKSFIMKGCKVDKTSGYILTVQNVNDEVFITDNILKQTNDALPRAMVTVEATFTGSAIIMKDNYFRAKNNSQVAINDLTTNTPAFVIQNNVLNKATINSTSTLKSNNVVNGVVQ